jgi:osmoprotectant transport system ATP-binding protein
VARFVGSDRGLKRLSLRRVGDLPLRTPVTARPGDDAAEVRRRVMADPFAYLLLVDEARRPIGWIKEDRVPTSGTLDSALAEPMSPLLNRRATLKDALSLMLDADVQAGIVVDRAGAVDGLITVDQIAELMRETARPVTETGLDPTAVLGDPLELDDPVDIADPAVPADVGIPAGADSPS